MTPSDVGGCPRLVYADYCGDDDFLHLDGNSISAMRLVRMMRGEQWPLSVVNPFRSPILSYFAAVIDSRTA